MTNVFRLRLTASGTRNEAETASVARLAMTLTVAAALGAAAYFGFLYLITGR